ncbi:MAG: Phosphoribosylamine/glycine ligase [Candidatus Magasanikbacteria bacterium GW2011_GWC2_37_14]|uniref:Glycinamide ribonucleotide synthetase n=1 Tax=Candidatus Magasanikbacteria bacterium GW2011_GWC2_37_14 TaxID=1619046 RepID=A0A0G0JGZ7_9BACT|nr:MAG: Phosphoribosylamine/glycine ligase [Candidatus Magasanikbacteria bacterium GW2011_GWC2_37_14]
MRVLFVSSELIAGDVAYRLKQEGCDVKLFIGDISRKDCFENMVKKTDNWQKELTWVGKKGLIVFDDVGYGKIQDQLRKDGYTVFGECHEGDKLEKDREFAQEIFAQQGLDVEVSKNFNDPKKAIAYIKKYQGKWVVKQNAHLGSMSYVGVMPDGSDVASVIKSYQKYNQSKAIETLTLQKKVEGVEVAVGRFFNGRDWTSPICVNFEHKPFFHGNIGPLTAEMGTLAWYDNNEKNKLFQASLAKLKPYLQKIAYKGYVDINCIVSNQRVVPLEATMRFGSPTNHLQSQMHLSKWKDLLWASASGKKFNLKYRKGYSIVVALAIPPFPYATTVPDYLKGLDVFFKKKLTKEEWERIHFEEVSLKKKNSRELYIAGGNGYILFITGSAKTVEHARLQVYKLIDKIVIPKIMYRMDIGEKFINNDKQLLTKWGWLKFEK